MSLTSSVVAARPTPIHLKPLSATVVALIRFISHLNIKICKLLSLKLQINQIRVVFSHLILLLLVTRNKFSTIFAAQNKFVGLLLFVIYWSIFLEFFLLLILMAHIV